MLGSSSQYEEEHVMGHMKKLVGLCVGLMMIVGSVAVAQDSAGGKTKVIKTHETATFVSANFDFDHADLSDPASYSNGEGTSNAGKFTDQAVIEFAPDGNKCTVPGGVANAGTEFKLVGNVAVVRFTATLDLLFYKGTSATVCQDFSTPPFPFLSTTTETGVVTGGTGKYLGATGTFTLNFRGATLALDATGVRVFGWVKGNGVTTITLP
jgi:hypothetical protein